MDIFEITDCKGCPNFTHGGDGDDCLDPSPGPCRRMLGALHDAVRDGLLETEHGKFYTGECLKEAQKEEGVPEGFRAFDFSSAFYYWLPDNYDVELFEAYMDEKEIYNAWFV